MDSTYEIFRDDPRGPLWIESVVGLERASERLAAIYKGNPATYFAFDARESRIVAKVSVESRRQEAAGELKRKGASGAA
ncbi:MAG TPA: hypothetical protein VHX49_11965 [Candidatus Acidoferrales bacterium]|jgi:hypothetical protein|nr:hypothetical protein [Candidatus Acidoferrales bacterium]